MKTVTATCCILLAVFALSGHALASENARIFMDGTAAYAKGDFPAAIEAFESLAGKGVEISFHATAENILFGCIKVHFPGGIVKRQSALLVGRIVGGADHIIVHQYCSIPD